MSNYKLLTIGNPKTEKSVKYGYATAVLHLAPASLSGQNVCPQASAGCIAACLNTAGRGGIFAAGATTNAIQEARIRRTQWLYSDRVSFLAALHADCVKFIRWCRANDLKPAFRFNGTSDLDWDGMASDITATLRHEGAARYDYTKVANRAKRLSADYTATFSLSETNEATAAQWLANGGRVAVVFRTADLPATYTIGSVTRPVVDGDAHDLQFLHPAGVIVGLKAKGRAKKDVSGFVRD